MHRFIFKIQIVGGNLAVFDDNQHNLKNCDIFSGVDSCNGDSGGPLAFRGGLVFNFTNFTDKFSIKLDRFFQKIFMSYGSSINGVTVLGGERVKDFVTTLLRPYQSNVIRWERGFRNVPKLRDVSYGRHLITCKPD